MLNNKIANRISTLISALGMNKNAFSKAIGLENNVTIGRIINEDRSPSFEVLNKIIQTFGSINANWLLTGEGSMFLSEQPTEINTEENDLKAENAYLRGQVALLKEMMNEKCNSNLHQEIEDLKAQIKELNFKLNTNSKTA